MERVNNRSNADEMEAQPFYRFLRDTYIWHVVAQFALLFAIGGLPAVVWGGALRMCWVWHITWFVNSASHVWGYQDYNTGGWGWTAAHHTTPHHTKTLPPRCCALEPPPVAHTLTHSKAQT